MKKVAITLITVLIFCLAFAFTAVNAETAEEPRILISSARGYAGDEVPVEISLADNPGICAMTLEFDYNAESLELLSAAGNEEFGGMWVINPEENTAVFANMGKDIKSDGSVLTLTFKVKDAAKVGSAKVTVTYEAGNWSQEKVNFTVEPGTIEILCDKVKVSFDANGGSGEMAAVELDKGTTYILPACKFTAPEGKEFDKWDKGAAGAKITVNGDVTIKAEWQKKPAAIPAPPVDEPETPETGDAGNMLLWVLTGVLSMGGIAAAARLKRKHS